MAESSLYEGWHSASTALADNVHLSGDSIYAIAEGSSWSQAQASAEKLGGNLVTINSAEENIYVFKNFGFEEDVTISSGYWIGLTDQENEGDWKWISSDDSSWSPYGWGQPGHEPNGNGDHAWVKAGFDHLGKSYAEYVEVHDNHWSEYQEPLWLDRGPSWDDTGEPGQGTNYGVAEIPFIQRDDSAYVVVEGSTWEEVAANASELGGNLITLDSVEEFKWGSNNLWSSDYLQQLGYEDGSKVVIATGFNDKDVEGVYEWDGGATTEWENLEDLISAQNHFGQQIHFQSWDYGYLLAGSEGWDSGSIDARYSPYDERGSIVLMDDTASFYVDNGYSFAGIAEISLGLEPAVAPASIGFTYELEPQYSDKALSQNAVLGDSVDHESKYHLDIFAESLAYDYRVESTDFTINFDPFLFENISASDIRIGEAMPISNAVLVDNESGTIRIAASSLSDVYDHDSNAGNQSLDLGSGITENPPNARQKLATIAFDFSESNIQDIGKNDDGSLKTNPLSFQITANDQETVFSKTFTDNSGLTNREIVSLADLGGGIEVTGQDVTLYEAKVNLAQQGDGLVLGTQRVIGSDASITNLVRSGDTLTTSAEWLNVGNIQANNLSYEGLYNQNASLVSADFSKSSIASGSFIDGVFVKDERESTVLTTDIKITGEAGNVVDLSDGIVSVKADAEGSDSFSNAGKGSSNLITFQGDLNYDGRVSMKDLAYLNAGAARQQLIEGTDETGNAVQVASEASYARDVDADFSGKIDLADLSVLDADWGKTLHTGDEQFQGSADVSWSELDSQGSSSTWENDSFKDQNAIEADTNYVGSLESPSASGVIGADGNTTANDNDITGTNFQDQIPA